MIYNFIFSLADNARAYVHSSGIYQRSRFLNRCTWQIYIALDN